MSPNNHSPENTAPGKFTIYQGEIDILREKTELFDDLYPASAEAIRRICNRVENRGVV
jgi:hypothetical protein